MKAINKFEELLQELNNTRILKFIFIFTRRASAKIAEQIKDPKGQWKYNGEGFVRICIMERVYEKYEDCFEHCNNCSLDNYSSDPKLVQRIRNTEKYPGYVKVFRYAISGD